MQNMVALFLFLKGITGALAGTCLLSSKKIKKTETEIQIETAGNNLKWTTEKETDRLELTKMSLLALPVLPFQQDFKK